MPPESPASIPMSLLPGRQAGAQLHKTATGLRLLSLQNRFGCADILLQGAQLLRWQPIGTHPLTWLSPEPELLPQKSPHGGIPICWPWFGPHGDNPTLPAHGFARTADWSVHSIKRLHNGSHRLTLRLPSPPSPKSPRLTACFTIGPDLTIELTTLNSSNHPIIIGEALHTYFTVGDIRQVRVHGLNNQPYIDKTEAGILKRQRGAIRIHGETDRVYVGSRSICTIEDPVLQRRIRIEKKGSNSTIIWNPWAEKSAAISDMGADAYLNMLCVESGNALQDQVTVPPGAAHRLWVRYRLRDWKADADAAFSTLTSQGGC